MGAPYHTSQTTKHKLTGDKNRHTSCEDSDSALTSSSNYCFFLSVSSDNH